LDKWKWILKSVEFYIEFETTGKNTQIAGHFAYASSHSFVHVFSDEYEFSKQLSLKPMLIFFYKVIMKKVLHVYIHFEPLSTLGILNC